MIIHSAEFIEGAAFPGQFPASYLPEVAFAGKSNVGKSSLINALLNRKNLVKTSSTPGRTRQINFFLINGTFRLVDLPGYGFSRAARSQQEQWETLVETYLKDSKFLRGVVLIVDARHSPSHLDRIMLDWLLAHHIPYLVIANKIDKLKKSQVNRQLETAQKEMGLRERLLPFSAKTRAGREALALRIEAWLADPKTDANPDGIAP